MLHVSGTTATAEADTNVYSLMALKKAAYRLADRCTVVFGSVEGTKLPLQFVCPAGVSEAGIRDLARGFFDEALDYDLREKISSETTPLRNLILAHAFSRTKLIQNSEG